MLKIFFFNYCYFSILMEWFVTDMGYDRYKFVVQVAIGEQRGEGVK